MGAAGSGRGPGRQRTPQPHQLLRPSGVSQWPSLSTQPSCCQARGWHLPQTPQEPGHQATQEKDRDPGRRARHLRVRAPQRSEASTARPGGGASLSASVGLPPEPGGLPLSRLGDWPVREARGAGTGTHTHVSTAHTYLHSAHVLANTPHTPTQPDPRMSTSLHTKRVLVNACTHENTHTTHIPTCEHLHAHTHTKT